MGLYPSGITTGMEKTLGNSPDKNAFSVYWFLVTASPLLGLPGLIYSKHIQGWWLIYFNKHDGISSS